MMSLPGPPAGAGTFDNPVCVGIGEGADRVELSSALQNTGLHFQKA